jgi:streptogramin lyase
MCRYRLLATLGLLALLSCSDDAPLDNTKATTPESPSPADQSANQPSSLELSWSGTGKHYDVYLGTTTNPPLVAHDLTVPHYHPSRLTPGAQYYWRVASLAMIGGTDGPLWSFTTAPGVPPVPPSQPVPADGASVALDQLDLTWSEPVPADTDTLTFNVFFGTDTDPQMVASDVAERSYLVSVFAGYTYYWRVEATNRDGLASSSPTWHFKADPVPGHMYNMAGTGTSGLGDVGQLPLVTKLFRPEDIAFAPDGSLVVVDWNNHRVLGIDPTNGAFYQMAGSLNGMAGDPCGAYPAPCDGVDAVGPPLNHPTSVTFRSDGMMVVPGWHNASLFMVDVAGGVMSRIAGTGNPCYDGEEKAAIASCIYLPSASVYDLQGRLCFTDQYNMIVRMIDTDGVIHLLAGQAPVWNGTRYVPQPGFSGDEGPATSAKFKWDGVTTCGKLCIDASGNIYVADTMNHAVRMIDTSGIIHRFAGLYPATPGFGGDGGPATAAQLNQPRDVASDAEGDIFIADTGNQVIRMVTPAGIISTVAGVPGVTGGTYPDGNRATESPLFNPFGIEIDPHGNLWIADSYNSRIRVVYR